MLSQLNYFLLEFLTVLSKHPVSQRVTSRN